MANTTTSKHSAKISYANVLLALTNLAIFRGAKMDRTTINTYARRLELENEADVIAALKVLENTPRREGETAMPDMPTILAAVDAQKRARLVRASAQAEERLVRWKCPDCGATCCGFVKPGETRLRHCRGIPQKKLYTYGEVCGKVLEVVADLPASVASGR